MTPKETIQRSGKEVRGAEQVQTPNMTTIRLNTLKQSDGKDRSNRPSHHLRRKQAQRSGPVSKMTLATAGHLKILAANLGEVAQGDTHLFRQEGGEDHIIRTTGRARGPGTRCLRAKRHRQGV